MEETSPSENYNILSEESVNAPSIDGSKPNEEASGGACSSVRTAEYEKALKRLPHLSVVIKLCGGQALVWRSDEWLKLKNNRIEGHLIGTPPGNLANQVQQNCLPLSLMPEEVTLIIEKNLGKVYRYKKNRPPISKETKENYKKYLEKNKEEQVVEYKRLCREQVNKKIDIIIQGKKNKHLKKQQNSTEPVPELEIDREKIIEIETEKKIKNATASHLVYTPIASPFITKDSLDEAEWNYPETPSEKVRYRVFKDLYEKGYTLTSASKFGGDFLVYPGDPDLFHSHFIVVCREFEEEFNLLELIQNVRVGVFTRKNLILASIDENDEMFYKTFSWPGRGRFSH